MNSGRVSGGLLVEVVAVGILCAVSAWTSARMQQVTVTRYWDGDEYYTMAEQVAAGEAPHAAAPYVYRLATPWIVGRFWPDRLVTGFRAINLTAAAATAALLLIWLRRFVAERWARLVVVALFVVEWHGPVRFVAYYPVYVDPLVFPFLLGGLMAIETLRAHDGEGRGAAIALLTALSIVGTLCREVMIVVPLAWLGDRGVFQRGIDGARRFDWMRLIPFAASMAVLVATREWLHPRLTFSFAEVFIFHLRDKPVYTWILSWFITFGPVLLLVAYDWRAAWRTLSDRPYLATYLVLFSGLSYVGGHDTERYLFWSMPVVYLLVAQALVDCRAALASTYLVAVLAVAQLVSARVPWSIPSPSLAVAPLADLPTAGAKAYSILNRLFVIDDFHWNLWSNFGSRPFHALLLAIYVAFSAAMIAWIRARAARTHAV